MSSRAATYEAIQHLVNAEHPEVSTLGMALTATSLIEMQWLGRAKQRLAAPILAGRNSGPGFD